MSTFRQLKEIEHTATVEIGSFMTVDHTLEELHAAILSLYADTPAPHIAVVEVKTYSMTARWRTEIGNHKN